MALKMYRVAALRGLNWILQTTDPWNVKEYL